MLKLKKLVVPVMVTTMALSALTACGGKDEPAAADTTVAPPLPRKRLRKPQPRQRKLKKLLLAQLMNT